MREIIIEFANLVKKIIVRGVFQRKAKSGTESITENGISAIKNMRMLRVGPIMICTGKKAISIAEIIIETIMMNYWLRRKYIMMPIRKNDG